MPTSDDDLKDVLREERSRGRKQPVNADAERLSRQREAEVLRIFREGNEDDLRAFLKLLDLSDEQIAEKIIVFRKLRVGQSPR